MAQYFEINGKTFTVKGTVSKDYINSFLLSKPKTLFECYSRMSQAKKDSYDAILAWYGEAHGVTHLSVVSHNVYKYTVESVFTFDNKRYLLRETRDHLYAFEEV